MTSGHPPAWTPDIRGRAGPIYKVIADAIAADIAAGVLAPGQRLPTHRALAAALRVDLTTVTRAYGEARRRGLIDGTVGRGTHVLGTPAAGDRAVPAEIDLSMNLPPQPEEAAVRERLAQATAAVLRGADPARLMTYRPSGGGVEDRAAGVAWLAPLLPGLPAERVLVCGGGQAALTALLTTLVRCGDTVLAERVTYPGFRAAAAQLGLRVEAVAMDGGGLLPDALEEAVARHAPKALYTVPTIQNPTTATMPPARRAAVAAVLRRHALPVIEDDAYGALPHSPLAPLAALVPDLAWYLATLSKSLMPGLRIAYLVAPDEPRAARARAGLRATAQMAPPLSAAIATRWIRDGTAHAIRDTVRAESTARQDLARRLLPPGSFDAHPQGHHLWLRLPAPWTAAAFAGEVRRSGLAVVPDTAFATGAPDGNALRLSLGAAPDRDTLHAALTRISTTLAREADALAEIV